MKLLENKTAIITGATRGIGRGIALEFAKQGAHVAFTYSSSVNAANSLEKELKEIGVNAKGYQSNAANFDEAQELAKNVLSEFGNISIRLPNFIFGIIALDRVEGIKHKMGIHLKAQRPLLQFQKVFLQF